MHKFYRTNKKIRFHLLFFYSSISICLFILLSCCSHKSTGYIDEGIIQYDITYSNRDGKNFPFQLLPKVLVMKFNKSFSCYTLEDRLGLFSISNLLNTKENKHTTLIKVFDKKYVYSGKKNEPSVLFDTSLDYVIDCKSDTSRILGYLCKSADITDKSSNKNFSIRYTDSIGVQFPNKNTPYEKIDGMLLEFRLTLKNLEMQLIANNIKEKEIHEKEFIVPEGYKAISRKQMEEIITTILP